MDATNETNKGSVTSGNLQGDNIELAQGGYKATQQQMMLG